MIPVSKRLAWVLWGAGMVLVIATWALLWSNRAVPTPPRWGFRGVQSLIALPVLTSGAWIVAHRPRNRIGWMMLSAGLFASVTGFAEEYAVHAILARAGQLPWGAVLANISQWLWLPAYALLNIFVPLYFPDGRLVSARWRIVVRLGGLWILLGCLWLLFAPGPLPNLSFVENPLGLPQFAPLYRGLTPYPFLPLIPGMFLMFAAVGSLAVRYRRAGHVVQQQIKWLLFGASLTAFAGFIGYSGYFGILPQPLANLLLIAMIYTHPLAILIAILRYDLYSIDLLINRALVYGTLTALIVALYVGVVGAVGAMLQTRSNLLVAFLATGLAALLFQPLRDWLQRRVNRWMYGERDDPATLLSRLGEQLEKTGTPEAALKGIVETVAQALKLPYAAIALGEADDIVAAYGLPQNTIRRFPLTYQGERVGELQAAERAPGEAFTPKDRRLLETVAHQAGAVAHAARLTADLRRAHQRLITAREEERRRIRRDLHDGLGPQLAGQMLTLSAARRLVAEDPQAADALLDEAIRHAQAATDDVRRLVHGLRPPVLDDLGLVEALRLLVRRVERSGLTLTASLPDTLDPLPSAVETACYFICQEALSNVLRHAQASHCRLKLTAGDELCLQIADDGVGIPAKHHPGIGLPSMRRRAVEIGGSFAVYTRPEGGTRLEVCLPIKGGL